MKPMPARKEAETPPLRLHGYSPWPPERIADALARGAAIGEVPGDFVLIDERTPGRTVLTSSVLSAFPYYYFHSDDGRLFHGPNVFGVVADSRIAWAWDVETIVNLALLDHPAGHATLHPLVKRLPAAAVVTFVNGTLDVRRDAFWTEVFPRRRPGTLDEAAQVFDGVMDDYRHDEPVVSLSAGLDSRVVLAAVMRQGYKPAVATMGRDDSTDVVVASSIAKSLGLDYRTVHLDPSDYFSAGEEIVSITSGMTTASHWHTHLFMRDAGYPANGRHFVGTNGEFARSFLLDKGIVTRLMTLASLMGVDAARFFWLRKERQREPDRQDLDRAFPPVDEHWISNSAMEASRGPRGLSDRLDYYYATTRVRNFQGGGLAIYNASLPTVSPFLDARWIKAIGSLRRSGKLGNNFHRRAIHRNYPSLLDFPIETGGHLTPRARPLYWTGLERSVGYSPFDDVLRSKQLEEIVNDSPVLGDLFPSELRQHALRTKRRLLELMMTLHYAGDVAGRTPR